ncbi:MAG: TlpA family protein disulfide reductase [Acidobacteriota bacterium]|nr:TlpA family protein disulfide reductase [Acidobacteriota bacterium]MDQ5872351.1 TlpA family protein disulfide reductase [Acidobacteriota bacterium]
MLAALLLASSLVLGKPAPAWPELRWVQGGPLALSDLRGKVVLVRFFTDPDCPYCSATAPALNELHREFGGRGLVVVGFYTPKPSPRRTTVGHVRKVARKYGFSFPVAVDDEWKALRRLWLDREDSGWTSVSLLIDRKGVVRHVHPGGVFAKDSADPEARRDYAEMREAIEALLTEKETP